jgi:hypothetical protein
MKAFAKETKNSFLLLLLVFLIVFIFQGRMLETLFCTAIFVIFANRIYVFFNDEDSIFSPKLLPLYIKIWVGFVLGTLGFNIVMFFVSLAIYRTNNQTVIMQIARFSFTSFIEYICLIITAVIIYGLIFKSPMIKKYIDMLKKTIPVFLIFSVLTGLISYFRASLIYGNMFDDLFGGDIMDFISIMSGAYYNQPIAQILGVLSLVVYFIGFYIVLLGMFSSIKQIEKNPPCVETETE